MYEVLEFRDPAWAGRTTAAMARFAEEHRDVLEDATRACRFPADIYREMGRRGWVGSITPSSWGGAGGGAAEYCLIGEEVGRHGLVSPQISVQGQRWLLDWGSEEQQQRWLGPLATGEAVFSESISEPGMGSSFKQMRTTARRDGDDWVITGSKTHVNLGAQSDVTLVYAIADEGLTSLLVPMDELGITAGQTEPIGLRLIPTADIEFDAVRVPGDALLGDPGQGLQTFLSTFNLSRLGNASELIGFARRGLVEATDYARAREVGDQVVTDFQGIQWTLADAYASLYAAALARDHAANQIDRDQDPSVPTTLAKQLAIEAAEFAGNEVFALVGGHGLYRTEIYAQLLDDIKVLRIAGGSREILRNHLAKSLLKDPDLRGLR